MLTKEDRKRLFQGVAYGLPSRERVRRYAEQMDNTLGQLEDLRRMLMLNLGLDGTTPSNLRALDKLEELRTALVKLDLLRSYFADMKKDITATSTFTLRAMRRLNEEVKELEGKDND